MKTTMKKTITTTLAAIVAVLITTTAVQAIGTLTPSGTAGDNTQYTLNDIYARLTTNATALVGSGSMSIPGSVTASFRTLSEIYDAIPTIDATKVATGTSYLGVAGNAIIGTPELEWSTAQPNANWAAARNACTALVENSPTVVGADNWRLPTITELLAGISDDWIIDGSGSRFASSPYYWSSTEYDGSYAWSAYWNDNVNGSLAGKTFSFSVLCVR